MDRMAANLQWLKERGIVVVYTPFVELGRAVSGVVRFQLLSDAGFYNVIGNQNGKELMTDSRIVALDSKNRLKPAAPKQK